MAARKQEILEVAGREVAVTNPDKVYFPRGGAHEARPRPLLPRRRRRGAARRPAAGRWRSSASSTAPTGEPFFQKRAPDNRPDVARTATLTFPSGRTADEIVVDDAARAGLGRQPRLHRPQPAPGPRRRPRPPRRAAGRPRPGAGRRVGADPRGRAGRAARRSRPSGSSAGRRRRARAASTSTSGSSRAGRSRRCAARRWPWPATSSGGRPTLATSKWWKEERHGVFLDYNQNAKDRTVASAYSVRPLPDARVSTPLTLGRGPDVEAEAFTIATVPARFARDRRPGRRHRRRRRARWRRCWSCAARHEAEGDGRRPVAAELREAGRRAAAGPAVAQAPRPKSEYEPGRGEAGGPPPEVAAERAAAVAAGDPNAGLPTEWEGSRPTPTGRRKTDDPGHRDLPGRDEGRGARGPRALEGAPPRGRRRTSSRPTSSSTGCAAALALVPRPGQPHPRPGGGPAGAGAARPR